MEDRLDLLSEMGKVGYHYFQTLLLSVKWSVYSTLKNGVPLTSGSEVIQDY